MNIILQICYRPPLPAKDGGTIVMNDLYKKLKDDKSNKVYQFIISTSKHPIEKKYYKNYNNYFTSHINTSFQLKQAFNYFPNAILTRFNQQSLINDLNDYIENIKPDKIIADGLYSLYVLDLLKNKHLLSKTFYRSHNIEYFIWERRLKFNINFFKKIILKPIVNHFKKEELRLVNKLEKPILYISKKDKKLLNIDGAVIGFNTPKINIQNTECSGESIFFLGTMNWGPNIDGITDFITSEWKKIQKKIPNLQFYIAGRNYEPNPLLENQKGIHVLGEIDNLEEIYNKGKITIIPIWYGSGIKVKIIEALYAGKCIITTPIGIEGIDVKNNHNIIVCESNEEITNRLFDLLDNKEKIEHICKNAKLFADNHFDENSIRIQLNKILNQ